MTKASIKLVDTPVLEAYRKAVLYQIDKLAADAPSDHCEDHNWHNTCHTYELIDGLPIDSKLVTWMASAYRRCSCVDGLSFNVKRLFLYKSNVGEVLGPNLDDGTCRSTPRNWTIVDNTYLRATYVGDLIDHWWINAEYAAYGKWIEEGI